MATASSEPTVELTAEIVRAYLSRNLLPPVELPKLIVDVHNALQALGKELQPVEPKSESRVKPAVSIRESVTPEFLICLDDGKRLKMLVRHLAALGMTPEQYREKWRLPPNYPMVAPNYSAARARMAKAFFLNQKHLGKAGKSHRPRAGGQH